jgi:hypothetical protein
VLEKRSLQKILGPKTEEMTGQWKNLRKDNRNILIILQYNLGDHGKENEKAGHIVGVCEIS